MSSDSWGENPLHRGASGARRELQREHDFSVAPSGPRHQHPAMLTRPLRLVLAALGAVLATPRIIAAETSAPAGSSQTAGKKHPLRGVITGLMPERSALLVKHEAIPGVMRAMTMMFRVDAATLAAAKEGQAITGLMSRQGDTWVLEDVKPAPAKP
jgi:Cu/Ag efflux protein CusF